MRTILFTGKGGVGKTSVAAATALRSAELGHRTVVMSTDPAHSLADSFGRELGGQPVQVCERLDALEINSLAEIEANWSAAKNYLSVLFASQGVDSLVADELSVFPGMEELFSLLKIKEYRDAGTYDVCLVDCAPTGSTLRMLSFPEVVRWYMKKLFHLERKAVALLRPVSERLWSVPLPTDEYFASLAVLYEKVDEIKQLLSDDSVSTARLVLNLEKMVLQETRRAYTYLHLFGFAVDGVVVNRIMPEAVQDAYFDNWKQVQERYLADVETSFTPLTLFKAPLFPGEVVGLSALAELANALYDNQDPTQVYPHDRPMEIAKDGAGYRLTLKLPFAVKGDLNLIQRGDDLTVSVGQFKRNLILPLTVAGRSITGARLTDDGTLEIRFASPADRDAD
jgi:arsenite-transporting ATPase